jgi:TorA maturation chaperone TorD
MTTPAAPEAEELARARLYGLIARLFYLPPDAALVEELARSRAFDGEESALAGAWRDMVAALRSASLDDLEAEHTKLFIGTGKAEVTPYLSHYVLEHASDNPLVALREQLGRWGIGRRPGAGEPEDHIAGVCEAMRFAIAAQQRNLDEQKVFFERFLYKGAIGFCGAVSACEKARFYRHAARFAQEFLDLEQRAFEIG